MPNLEVVIARLIFAENVFFASEQLNIKRNGAKNVCCAKLFMCKEGILRTLGA
jgi:phosphopantetheinyl transferase (holo-ACP synthase)